MEIRNHLRILEFKLLLLSVSLKVRFGYYFGSNIFQLLIIYVLKLFMQDFFFFDSVGQFKPKEGKETSSFYILC